MASTSKHSKKRDNGDSDSDTQNSDDIFLIPGLPNHLAERCLSMLPPHLIFSVSRLWRRLLYSPSFPPFFSLYALLSPSDKPSYCLHFIEFFSLDPISSTWSPLPSPPQNPPLRLLHRHPSYLSRKLPVQSLTVSNNLVLIAATTPFFVPTLSSPLIFNPLSNKWSFGPPFSMPRRWCATGSVGGVVYVASGFGSEYRGDIGRSMEAWDFKSDDWRWAKKADLKDSKFSREAVEAVGFKGSLCMVNIKGNMAKEGAVYEVEFDKWRAMPEGMLVGWKGPAAAMNEDELYVVDEVRGALRRYDIEKDRWDEVIELAELKGAEQISASRGRVCVVCANGERIAVVDVVARPAKAWMVEPPTGFQVVSVHVLPRMSRQD